MKKLTIDRIGFELAFELSAYLDTETGTVSLVTSDANRHFDRLATSDDDLAWSRG